MFQARVNRRNNHIVDARHNGKRGQPIIQKPLKTTLPSFNTPAVVSTSASTAEHSSSTTQPQQASNVLPSGFTSRIPTTLQQVFLSSNRGNDVDKPPPMMVANRMFRTFWSKTFTSNKSNNRNGQPKEEDVAVTAVVETNAPPVTAATSSAADALTSTDMSPQDYLDQILSSRGYPTTRYKTLQTSYYNKPTALQMASYSRFIIDIIKASDKRKFQQIMMCGISTNPCNTFGESSLHMVCRRGDNELLQILLSDDVKVELHVADDYGRTPLHDACWASNIAIDVINLIMQQNINENRNMFYMEDARGSLPLSYVHKSQYSQWIQYFDSVKDMYWPVGGYSAVNMSTSLVHQPPHTRPIVDPINALSMELATMVANGRLEPHEASVIKQQPQLLLSNNDECSATHADDDDSDDDDDDDGDSDDESDYTDSDEDDDSEDESENADVEMIQEMSTILYKQ